MDLSSTGPSVDSDLTDSWTLVDKENSESGDSANGDENECICKDDVQNGLDKEQSFSTLTNSADGAIPSETTVSAQIEGTESIDSDGISIISESEEEELELLPCNSSPVEERPISRSSNKYFDETDTASQCSSTAQEVMGMQKEKKYKHQPNSTLNTSLNVLLVISWAAVIGLGMGHFLGLQEECSGSLNADDKIKNDGQNEELSALLLKKLELENIALKEQFSHLQKMIEELHQKNSMAACSQESIPQTNLIGETGEKGNHGTNDLHRSECLLDSIGMKHKPNQREPANPVMIESSSDVFQTKENVVNDDAIENNFHPSSDIPEETDDRIVIDFNRNIFEDLGEEKVDNNNDKDGTKMVSSEEGDKNEMLLRLEKSLEDVAVLFNEKLNTNKISFDSSKEALSGTISVLSGLLNNLKERFNGLRNSMESDSLNFDGPLKALSKMEEVLQKTSEKVQKITEGAFKEGKPLFTISKKVTSKLQAINRKLEEKWCQVKKNLSKQSVIWSWLDSQIFQNCTEDNKIKNDVNNNKPNVNNEELSDGIRSGFANENIINSENNNEFTKQKKSKPDKSNPDLKNKQNAYIKEFGFGKMKDKYKRNEYDDPNSFDFKPAKGNNKENIKPSYNKERSSSMNKKDTNNDGNYKSSYDKYDKEKYEKGLPSNQSGEWVEAMFNHRAERRRDERRTDWFFARARSRARSKETQPSRWYLRKGETHAKL